MGRTGRKTTDTFSRMIGDGSDLLRRGDLPGALQKFQAALEEARRNNDAERANKAVASLSACYLEMGEHERAADGLREIILRSRDVETICAASYNLSISLRRQGKFQKAHGYAARAMEKSRLLGDLNWQARCHNLLGNIHLAQSRLAEALAEYERSLSIRLKEKKPNQFSIAILKDNIGYCQMLQGDYQKGTAAVRESLEMVTALGSRKCICECCHDLSFGYMQLGRLDEAEKYGLRALEIAEAEGYKEIVKNCFYLLGEINFLKGDEKARDHYFYRLQDLYPHLPYLRDFLCTFDVSKIIALRYPQ